MSRYTVYCTRSLQVKLKYSEFVTRRLHGKYENFSQHSVLDYMKKAMNLIYNFKNQVNNQPKFEACDELLLLTNQDSYQTIKDMMTHIEINGYAKNYKAVPSFVARLNYVTHKAGVFIKKLKVNDSILIIHIHKDGFEMFSLSINERFNFIIKDNNKFFYDFDECFNEYEKLKETCNVVIIVYQKKTANEKKPRKQRSNNESTDEEIDEDESYEEIKPDNEELVKRFPCFSIGYEDFEDMIYNGGLAKMEASIHGKYEVLDCAPLIDVQYYCENGLIKRTRILGPGISRVETRSDEKIYGFAILFGSEICFDQPRLSKLQNNVVIPFHDCDIVRINADVRTNKRENGMLIIQVFAHCDSIYEDDEIKDNNIIKNKVEDKLKHLPFDNVFNLDSFEYSYTTMNKDYEKECLTLKLIKDDDSDLIAAFIGTKDEKFVSINGNEELWTPMNLFINDNKLLIGKSAIKAAKLNPQGLVYQISELLGKRTTDKINITPKWKFTVSQLNGWYCYQIKCKDQKVNISPVFALTNVFNLMKCQAFKNKHSRFVATSTIIEIQKNMFNNEQLPYLLFAAGLAGLDVLRINFI